jgi:hypothetical protein
MISNNICPCKDCVAPKRHTGCHAACKEYKDWNIIHQQELDVVRKARNDEDVYINPMLRKFSKRRHK